MLLLAGHRADQNCTNGFCLTVLCNEIRCIILLILMECLQNVFPISFMIDKQN